MITTDANQSINRLIKILINEIECHKISIETIKDVHPQELEYLESDIAKLEELHENIKEYKRWQ